MHSQESERQPNYTRLSGIWGEIPPPLRPSWGFHSLEQSPGVDLGRSNGMGALCLCLWELGCPVWLCSWLLHKDLQPSGDAVQSMLSFPSHQQRAPFVNQHRGSLWANHGPS